jgi:hypothetical protein
MVLMRKVMMVVAAALVAFGGLAACSDGDDGASGSSTTVGGAGEQERPEATDGGEDGADDAPGSTVAPPTPGEVRSLDEWAGEFCAGFNTWVDELAASTQGVDISISPTDYAAQKAALATFFETQGTAAAEMVARVESGSVPSIEGGAALVDELIDLFSGLVDAAGTAGDDLEALDPDAPSFEADGQAVVVAYQDALTAAGDRFTGLADEYPELAEETSFEEDCVT